jgi:uncharacterized protein
MPPMQADDELAGPRVAELIGLLALAPHPEGGHYAEIHRSAQSVTRGAITRSAVTSIYFLLARGQHSRWHVVASDEVWHHYEGAPLELLTFDPASGSAARAVLGPVHASGARPVHTVPAHWWQAARSLGAFTLAGCTVAPGFEFADFRFVADLPGHERQLGRLPAGSRALL